MVRVQVNVQSSKRVWTNVGHKRDGLYTTHVTHDSMIMIIILSREPWSIGPTDLAICVTEEVLTVLRSIIARLENTARIAGS